MTIKSQSDTPNPEQSNPSFQRQEDGYAKGVDLIGMIATEFGVARLLVTQQLSDRDSVEVWVGDEVVKPDKNFRIPYSVAKGNWIAVVGGTVHYRMRFLG